MDTEELTEADVLKVPAFYDVLAVELAAMITKVADSSDSPNPVVRVGNELIRLLLTDMPMLRAEYRRTLKRPCSETLLKKEIVIELLSHTIDRFYGTPSADKDIDPLEQSLEAMAASTLGSVTKLAEGTVLKRQYGGREHVVTFINDAYEYQGQRFHSATAVARHITGTACSGPQFFSAKTEISILPRGESKVGDLA
jgi:hypothetical protein